MSGRIKLIEKEKKKKAEEKIEEMEKEKAELSDRLLRKVAEFDNYRKRTEKEKAATQMGCLSFIFSTNYFNFGAIRSS